VIHRYIPKAARAKVDGSLRWISFFLIVLCPAEGLSGWAAAEPQGRDG
jgi:hypothetical protein